jgi:uroporphyrinogen III methyltransferase/synthase
MNARVFVVGGGPGDPELVTVRGAELLAAAEVVLHDAAIHPELLARAVSAQLLVSAPDPRENAHRAAIAVRAGKRVVRLVAGDPLFFSTADAEILALQSTGIDVEIVPGIPRALALGAYTGVPLTRSTDASPTVAFAAEVHESDLHDWEKLAGAMDLLVLQLPASRVAEAARSLLFYGRSGGTPVALVANPGTSRQRVSVCRLEDAGQEAMRLESGGAPLHVMIGEAVALREKLAWLERRPLFGKRVLVTRPKEQAQSASALLRDRGAEPVLIPTIRLHPPEDAEAFTRAVAAIGSYQWIAFTSANGVERTLAEVARQGKDARVFGGTKIAAIGPGTARTLERFGLRADVVASELRGEGLAEAMIARLSHEATADAIPGHRGAKPRVLLLRAKIAREVLPDALRAAGCEVDAVAAYETRAPEREVADALSAAFAEGGIDAVLFTSGSTVEQLCALLGERARDLLARARVVSIGPITTAAAEKRGIRVDATAAVSTLDGLMDATETALAAAPARPD